MTTNVTLDVSTLSEQLSVMYQALVKAGHVPEGSALLAAIDEVEELLFEEACTGCLAPSNDGEGWDGYCGNCADKRDHLYENGSVD